MPRIASWCSASALIIALHAPVANAELWGFVDEAGLAHFASTRLDDRYQLFFRGKTNLDAEREASKRKSTAAFEQTPLYRRVVGHPNVRRFASLIEQSARARALDPSLIMAIIAVESAFEPGAMSTKGALGLMQIIPATAVRYGVVERPGRTVAQQLFDPATNVRIGVRYLRDLLDLFNDDLPLALAAYNAGEESVRQSGNRIPPFRETREYVELVRQFQAFYEPPEPIRSAPSQSRIELLPP